MNHNDVNAVFHGHNEAIVKNADRFGLPITHVEYDSGTIALAEEVLKVLDNNRFIVLKNHGFVSVGKDMREAGEIALDVLNQSKIVSSDNM